MTENLRRRGGPETLLMTAAQDKSILGKNLAQIAQERNISPIEAALEIIRAGGSDVASFNMKESDIEAFMKQPWVMTCSDGSEGHPRKYGTFPRKIHEYVYEKHVLSLEAAVRSSTSLPAETLQIKDRGLLKPGYYADVLVFDPKTFVDRATYERSDCSCNGRAVSPGEWATCGGQGRVDLNTGRKGAEALGFRNGQIEGLANRGTGRLLMRRTPFRGAVHSFP